MSEVSRPGTQPRRSCFYNVLRDSGQDARGSHDRTTFRRLDHRRRPVRHRQACQVQAALPNKTIAILERRERLGGTWDLFRYPGVRSDSDMYTFGFKFRPWRDVQVLADGASIRQYIAETAAEFGIDDKIHYGLKVVERGLVQPREPLDGDEPSRGERRNPHLQLQLPHQLHGLLQLRRGLPADLPRCGPVQGSVHPPTAVAGGPRLRRQEGRRDRQWRNSGHPGPGDGRLRRARHHAAALPVVHLLVARARQDLRVPRSVHAGQLGVCVRAQAKHRHPASDVPGLPSLARRCGDFCSGRSGATSARPST